MIFIQTFVRLIYSICSIFYFSDSLNSQTIKQRPVNHEAISNEVTRLLIKEVETELGYKCEMSGGSMPRDIESIVVGFAIYERASVERAREIEVELTERFLRIINSHEKIRPFLREYPFPAEGAEIKLDFYQKGKRRPVIGDYICHVFQVRGEIYFYKNASIESYKLEEVAREKYEDALEIVKRNQSTSL